MTSSTISRLEDILKQTSSVDYADLFRLIKRNVNSFENEKLREIITGALSLVFSNNNVQQPFIPYMVMGERRSICIDDFTTDALNQLYEVVYLVEDYRLKARIADILWLAPNFNATKSDRAKLALLAIDAYSQFPINEISWHRGGKEAILRLCNLGLQINGKNKDFKESLSSRLHNALFESNISNSVYIYDLGYILYSYQLWERTDSLPKKMCQAGNVSRKECSFQPAIACYELACSFYKQLNNSEQLAYLYKLIAETHEEASKFDNPIFGQEHLSKAKNALKQIPKKYKDDSIKTKMVQFDVRIEDLREKAREQTFETSTKIDVTPYIIDTKSIISKLNKIDAIKGLLSLVHVFDHEELIKSAIERIKQTPLIHHATCSRFHRDGQLLETFDGAAYFSHLDDEDNPLIKQQVMIQINTLIDLYVSCRILPALNIIHTEHRYNYDLFVELCKLSTIVPDDRVTMFAKGLQAGFNYDFVTSAHILAPQLENLIRLFLKTRGINTKVINPNTKKESEKSLSALLELEEAKTIIGKNLSFTLYSVFCDDHGANIRNEIAHGFVDESIGNTPPYIYAWWLIFRIIAANQLFSLKIRF